MKIRSFILACLMLSGLAGYAAESGARRVIPLREGWRFYFGEVAGAAQPGFKDEAWASVTVPHTWNVLDATTPEFQRGQGWYRRRFATPALDPGERVILDFRAVSLVATVWLNGRQLGTHDNGFAAFRFDVTDDLRADVDNTLVVLADTTWREDLPPREGDFTLFGGIYREASLLITPAVAIDPLDHAGPGVYLATPEISNETARLRARVLVRNTRGQSQPLLARLTLRDAAGQTIAETSMRYVAPAGSGEIELEVTVDHARRWHGRRDPYLYTATVALEPEGGGAPDKVTQLVGFRTFWIDQARGFILNDEPYDLRGANLHQDRAVTGWVAALGDRERDLRLMLEMGSTFVRVVHYQHDDELYALADRLGLVVWAEHALVNTVSANPRFSERCRTQVTELIRQNFNHPSIVFWGIGNEVQTHKPPAAKTLLELLARQVRLEDPGRLSTLATNYGEPFGTYGTDSIAHNQYHGWYHARPEDFAVWLDGQRAKVPGQSIGMSEYGAGAGVSIHRDAPVALDHSEEYQAHFHEVYWRTLRDRPWVWCKAVWQMFDAASFYRKEGEQNGINDKGLVTRDRRTPKDAYYWYQANWSDAPMVHVTSRRFTPRTVAAAAVKVYSNCDTVELWLNGRSLGVRPVEDRIALWPEVMLAPGENRVETVGRRGPTEVRDACTWTFAPAQP